MNINQSIKKNFIMNAILTMSTFIFPLITFPYVSRVLLPPGTGKISFATSVISYFSILANLGIPTYGIRACAKVRDNREELTRTAHELLAINADPYQGFVYALDGGNHRIIYAEEIFCNYMMDLDYEQYIPADYLLDNFNAGEGNPYRKMKMNRSIPPLT